MLQGLNGNLFNTAFFQSPIQLLVGNSCWRRDVKDNLNEYEYINYYKVINVEAGVVIKHPYFNDYILIYDGKRANYSNFTVDGISDNLSKFFYSTIGPYWEVNGNQFFENPFCNCENGSTNFFYPDPSYQNRVWFDEKWNFGYSPNAKSVDGFILNNGVNDLTNGTGGLLNGALAISMNDVDSSISGIAIGRVGYFSPNTNIDLDLDNLNANSFNKKCALENQECDIANTYKRVENAVTLKIPSSVYVRSELAPDLDFENNLVTEKLVGVYTKPLAPTEQFSLGSWVLGDEYGTNFGQFIGFNRIYHPYFNTRGYSYTSDGSSYTFTNEYLSDLSNLDVLLPYSSANIYEERINQQGAYKSNSNNPLLLPHQILVGKTINLEKPKYLMYLGAPIEYYNGQLSLYEEPYTLYSFYIFEDLPLNIKSHRKFWKATLPIDMTSFTSGKFTSMHPIEIFQYPMKVYGKEITSLTFKYYNLDDEEDKRSDAILSLAGLTRMNPFTEIFSTPDPMFQNYEIYSGGGKSYNLNKCSQYFNSNVYIGQWATPAVKFED